MQQTEFETYTDDDTPKITFFPARSCYVSFKVKTDSDANIVLANTANSADIKYRVILAGWRNTITAIRKGQSAKDLLKVPTPQLLDGNEFRAFWVKWHGNTLSVGRNTDPPFLTYEDPEPILDINFVGIGSAWSHKANWVFNPPKICGKAKADKQREAGQPDSGGAGGAVGDRHWVAASSGKVPKGALEGGEDNGETEYVIRAKFRGGLIPGKLLPSHAEGYISWNGTEYPVNEYEVLCGDGKWVKASGKKIPSNAIAAGQSEDGETLFVGRVVYDGTITVGKVQPSHGVLYIPYARQELHFADYEVLCS